MEEEETFDKDEVYKYLNSNCIALDGDLASDSEDATVSREIASSSSWALSPRTEVHGVVRIIISEGHCCSEFACVKPFFL